MIQIIVDIREREILEKMPLCLQNLGFEYTIISAPLEIGDIIVRDDDQVYMIIERKTIADLLASLKDGRYSEQCLRLQTDERHHHV